jgi:glycosyltransferase involved in cell wall biosynthesis
LVPEKRVERAIDIAAQMRNGGHDVPLCIAGKSGDPRYLRRLRKRIRGKESWIEIRTDLTRKQLCALVAHYRYGLHVRENEQFGIGVAEMLKAGCIPFVAAGGGQTEIIDGCDQLIFDSEQQAVEKMARVMSCTQTQKRILETLQKRAQAFSPERFMAEIRKAVKDFLAA